MYYIFLRAFKALYSDTQLDGIRIFLFFLTIILRCTTDAMLNSSQNYSVHAMTPQEIILPLLLLQTGKKVDQTKFDPSKFIKL